jgi:hypothetical protein
MPRSVEPSIASGFSDACRGGTPIDMHGEGQPTRKRVSTEDTVAGALAALARTPCRVNNLKGDEETSVPALATMIADNVGNKSQVRVVAPHPSRCVLPRDHQWHSAMSRARGRSAQRPATAVPYRQAPIGVCESDDNNLVRVARPTRWINPESRTSCTDRHKKTAANRRRASERPLIRCGRLAQLIGTGDSPVQRWAR